MSLRENIARLVGEGYDQPQGDQSTPLSINYAKINEWMVRAESVSWDCAPCDLRDPAVTSQHTGTTAFQTP